MQPAATVIISTFNRPAVLDLVLRGFARQSRLDFEVVVADDGSSGETAAVVEAFGGRAPFPVRHLWQEDRGFRKTTILNRAVRESTADYLVFCDGDCLPHREYVRGHLLARESGRFLFGHAVFLGPRTTDGLDPGQVDSGRIEQWGGSRIVRALRGEDRRAYNGLFLGHGRIARWTARLWDRQGHRARGRNLSMFRDDLMAVNGWNQDYERPGREDDDLVWRLRRLGRRGKSVRFRAVAFHLYHPPHARAVFDSNDPIFQQVIRRDDPVCRNGIRPIPVKATPGPSSPSE